jgi:NAD(P)-dependent dehydrogenase (short-subunit alcohol dehydrogenase family)
MFGVRGYTEALRIELDQERCGVTATTIHPGGIKTNILRNARIEDPDAYVDAAAPVREDGPHDVRRRSARHPAPSKRTNAGR